MFRWLVAAFSWISQLTEIDKGMAIDPNGASADGDKGMAIDPDG